MITIEEVSKSIKELEEKNKKLKGEIEIVEGKIVELEKAKFNLFITAMIPTFILYIVVVLTGLLNFVL
jgi:hypothetical protein